MVKDAKYIHYFDVNEQLKIMVQMTHNVKRACLHLLLLLKIVGYAALSQTVPLHSVAALLMAPNKRARNNNSRSSPFGNSVQSSNSFVNIVQPSNSFGNVVVKNEVAENHDDSNFGESGLIPADSNSRNYPENLSREDEQLVIPNLGKLSRDNSSPCKRSN